MRYFKKLLGSVREFKAPAIFTIIFIILEVFIEVVIPFITADMVNSRAICATTSIAGSRPFPLKISTGFPPPRSSRV